MLVDDCKGLHIKMEDQRIPLINWLASYPKSGNTWVRTLLYAYKFGNVQLDQIKGFVTSDLLPGAWFAAAPVPWGMLTDDQKLLVRYTALMIIATTASQDRLIVKTHCACGKMNSVDLIPNELTEKAVYIVRDPRDVTISYARHMGKSIDEAIVKNPVSKNIMLKKEENESTRNIPPKSCPSGEFSARSMVKTMPTRAT